MWYMVTWGATNFKHFDAKNVTESLSILVDSCHTAYECDRVSTAMATK